jgi:hypothetical protein
MHFDDPLGDPADSMLSNEIDSQHHPFVRDEFYVAHINIIVCYQI